MNKKITLFSREYAAALEEHLKQGSRSQMDSAQVWGRRTVAMGLQTLDLARIHEKALAALMPPRSSRLGAFIAKRASFFFSEANALIEERRHSMRKTNERLNRAVVNLTRRAEELVVSNRQLKRGVLKRKVTEASLTKTNRLYKKRLEESLELQKRLRQLIHRVLAAQENERSTLSRELQDEIAQTLLGINARLLSLKKQAQSHVAGVQNKIALAQRQMVKSARSVRRVAREFGKT